MDKLDILDHLELRPYLCAWAAQHPAGPLSKVCRMMAGALGCSQPHAYSLIMGVNKVQPDDVPALARLLELDGRRLEYLRRLVALQNATEETAAQIRLGVWAMHAVHKGHGPFPANSDLSLCEVEGLWAATALALLPALEAHAPWVEDPEGLADLVFGGPDATAMAWAEVHRAEGALDGEALSGRLRALESPDLQGGLEDRSWHGLLELARDALVRVAAPAREYFLFTGSADERGFEVCWAAVRRLRRTLRAVLRKGEKKPVNRLYLALTEQLMLTEAPSPIRRKRPASQEGSRALTGRGVRSKSEVERGGSSEPVAEGPPCLLHYLEFSPYALAWMRWRQGARRGVSYRSLARKAGVSKSVLQALFNGAARVLPGHIPMLVRLMDLPEREAHYLEGLSRLGLATDPEDRAREYRALIAWAEESGVRTRAGESFKLTSHWGADAILALTDLPGFRPNAAWISMALRGRLAMSSSEDLLGALLRSKELVQSSDGSMTWTAGERLSGKDAPSAAIYAHHHSLVHLARAELLVRGAGQRHQGLVLALADGDLSEVLAAVRACRDEIVAALRESAERAAAGDGRLDRVFIIGLQLFPITPVFTRPPLRRGR